MKRLFIILAAAMCFTSCNTNEPATQGGTIEETQSANIFLTVSPLRITHSSLAGAVKYISIECNTYWEIRIENRNMFQSVSPTSGTGNKSIMVSFPEINYYERNSFVTQHGSITVSCKDENGKTLSKKVECIRKKE